MPSQSTCQRCGDEISIVFYDGCYRPFHRSNSGCAGGASSDPDSIANTGCVQAVACSDCGEPVYLVRHNGGCFCVDALGWPWPEHPCWLARQERTQVDAKALAALRDAPAGLVPARVVARVFGRGSVLIALVAADGGTYCVELREGRDVDAGSLVFVSTFRQEGKLRIGELRSLDGGSIAWSPPVSKPRLLGLPHDFVRAPTRTLPVAPPPPAAHDPRHGAGALPMAEREGRVRRRKTPRAAAHSG